jgi:hypothetical protein
MNAFAIQDISNIQDIESSYCEKENEKKYLEWFVTYIKTSPGMKNISKLASHFLEWVLYFSNVLNLSTHTTERLINLRNRFSFINKNLNITTYPDGLHKLVKSFDDYQKKDQQVSKKGYKLASKVAQTVADTSVLIQLFEILSFYSLGVMSPVVNFSSNFFTFVYNFIDLKIDIEDYFEHCKMQKIVESQEKPLKKLQKLFHEIKNLDLLNIAKAVISIAISIFLILDIIFKTVIVPVGPLLMLTTISTVVAIWAHFYKESMTYPAVF